MKLALLYHHEYRNGRDWLGRRGQVEYLVSSHRPSCFNVSPTLGIKVIDLAVAGDKGRHPRNISSINGFLHRGVNVLEALKRKADVLGPSHWQRRRLGPTFFYLHRYRTPAR